METAVASNALQQLNLDLEAAYTVVDDLLRRKKQVCHHSSWYSRHRGAWCDHWAGEMSKSADKVKVSILFTICDRRPPTTVLRGVLQRTAVLHISGYIYSGTPDDFKEKWRQKKSYCHRGIGIVEMQLRAPTTEWRRGGPSRSNKSVHVLLGILKDHKAHLVFPTIF